MRHVAMLIILLLPAATWAAPPAVATVYVVRHAEKLDGADPALSERGASRARQLAALLEDAGIRRIFSTNTRRTRDTAAPLAERLQLTTEIYDHREQAALATALQSRGENALVVGHSNTIAEFVAALGADPGEAVAENEFDRLYVVRLHPDGVQSELRRYDAGNASGGQ